MAKGLYKNETYRRVKKLGQGAFGSINLCQVVNYQNEQNKDLPEFVAIKKIPVIDSEKGYEKSVYRELKVLREFAHQNIVKLYDVFTENQNAYMVLEYFPIDMGKYLDTSEFLFTEKDIKHIFYNVLIGLKHLHDNYILHRDMKPPNVQLSSDGQVKLIDFGIATSYGTPNKPKTLQVCTRWYKPPEVIYGNKNYDTSLDVWSCGAILAEMYHKKPLFQGASDIDMQNKIFEIRGEPNEKSWPDAKELPYFWEFDAIKPIPQKQLMPGASDEALDLTEQMLMINPSYRITIDKAQKHKFFENMPTLEELSFVTNVKQTDYKFVNK